MTREYTKTEIQYVRKTKYKLSEQKPIKAMPMFYFKAGQTYFEIIYTRHMLGEMPVMRLNTVAKCCEEGKR